MIYIEGDPSLHVHVAIQEGTTFGQGSNVTLYCNYTKWTSDSVGRLAWTYGDEYATSTRIADFFLFIQGGDNPTYYDPISPPDYVMGVDGIDSAPDGGWSTLTIPSISAYDRRRYWCSASFVKYTRILMQSVDIIVGKASFYIFFIKIMFYTYFLYIIVQCAFKPICVLYFVIPYCGYEKKSTIPNLPHQVKTQYLHFRFHANYFPLPFLPEEKN